MARRRRREEIELDDEDELNESTGKNKRMRKSSSDEEADKENMEVDSDELDCSQHPDFPVSSKSEAEVGIIEKIVLSNFMCHTMLEVPFGSNVNFVIGKNGSGKSAIMTGLVVGLGGKATMTSRGNSLKGFIKDKCNSCQITIKLRNRGKDAYRPKEYGPSILVERKINADGGSSYKIKSNDGKVVSNKKDELIHILDQFNIQVDNPVSVLNQDTSRHFLNSSDPKDKYKFFLKATQLEQMSSDYQLIIEQQAIIRNTLDKKQETLPEMHREVRRLEEKYKDLAQLKNMKEQVEELVKERIWAEIIELEKKLDPLAQTVEEHQQREPKYKEKVDKCQDEIAKLEGSWQAVQEGVDKVTQDAENLKAEQHEINTELRQKKAAFREKQSKCRKLDQDKRSATSERKQLTDRIQEIKQTAIRDIESERKQREELLQQKKEEVRALNSQLSTTNHHKGQLEEAIAHDKQQEYQLRTDLQDARQKMDRTDRRLKQLKDSKQNRLKIFGSWVPQLLQKIEQNKRQFHRLPVGPIGAHLTLKEQHWAVAVESCLKRFAWSFCCHDNHDAHILKRMMMQVCQGDVPTIIASAFKDRVHDVSRNKPRCEFPTVLDVLSIENPVITNALIDQLGIESILLIRDPRRAREVMFRRPPAKVRMAYAGNGDQLFGGRSAKSFAASQSESRYLKQDVQAEIRRLEVELENGRREVREIQSEKDSLETSIREHTRELGRSKTKAFKEQEMTNKILAEIQELEEYEEEELPDVTTLEEEVEQYTQHIDELERELEQTQEEYESTQNALAKQELKNTNHREEIQRIVESAEQLKSQQQDIQVQIAKEKSHRKYFENKLKELQDTIKKAEADYARSKAHVEEKTAKASDVCERIKTRRSVRNLESEILQKEKRIRVEEKNHGKHEVITRQYFEAKTKYEGIKGSMKSLRRYSKRLEDVMAVRAKAYANYRHFIAVRAKYFFLMMLGQRGYGGKMIFDHPREALTVQVNVDKGTKRLTKDTRCLSGGERSFSTVSFIMALWEAMESPFRCLDEFDVFMDMVNRRISMEMLLKVAREQESRQFILLTPQDMSAIGSSKNVRIFKLRDPERGQTTLDFNQNA